MTRFRRLEVVGLTGATTAEPAVRDRFERFLCDEREALVNFLRRRTPTGEDAEDAAQESFARLMRYRDRQPESAWKPLLYRIASNVANDQLRHARVRHADRHDSFDMLLHDAPAACPPQDERLEAQQQLALIRAAILELPPRCRQVYLLSRMEGMSYREIANHLGISCKAVEKHVSKALVALREKLGSCLPGTLKG